MSDFVVIFAPSLWMGSVKKYITAIFLLWALVSCSNGAPLTPSAAPTSEGVASRTPTEAPTSAIPDPGDIPDPQGTPVQEWRGIPIMPEAIAGQEFSEGISYSFRANTSAKGVQEFYDERLTELGWSQPFNTSLETDGGMMIFRNEGSSLTITVLPSEGSVVVLLVLTLA